MTIRVDFCKICIGVRETEEGGHFRNIPHPSISCLGERIFIWGQQGVLSGAFPKLPPPFNPPLKGRVKIERKGERGRCESKRKREGRGMREGKEEINGKG